MWESDSSELEYERWWTGMPSGVGDCVGFSKTFATAGEIYWADAHCKISRILAPMHAVCQKYP